MRYAGIRFIPFSNWVYFNSFNLDCRWRPANLADSRYVWLVLTMGASAVPIDDAEFSFKFPQCKQVQIPWAEKWKLPEDWKGSA